MTNDGVISKVMVLPPGAKIRSQVVDQVTVTEAGFDGDRHAGLTRPAGSRDADVPKGTTIRNTRQISLVAQEDLDRIAEKLGVPEVKAEWLGANLALRGLPALSQISHGSRLRFEQGVVIVIEDENKPCRTPGEVLAEEFPGKDDLAARFAKEALGLRGLVGWVEAPGQLRVGEQVLVETPA